MRCERRKKNHQNHQTHYEFLNKRMTTRTNHASQTLTYTQIHNIDLISGERENSSKNETRTRFTDKLKLRDTRTIKINMKWQKEVGEGEGERQRETRKMGKNTLQQLCNVWAHKRAAAHAHPHKMVLRQQSDKMLLFCFAFCSKFASETKRQEQKRNEKLIILRGTAKLNECVLIGMWKNNKQKIDKFNARLSKAYDCTLFTLQTPHFI